MVRIMAQALYLGWLCTYTTLILKSSCTRPTLAPVKCPLTKNMMIYVYAGPWGGYASFDDSQTE